MFCPKCSALAVASIVLVLGGWNVRGWADEPASADTPADPAAERAPTDTAPSDTATTDAPAADPSAPPAPRPAADDQQLRRWLENMLWYHRYSDEEVQAAIGLAPAELPDTLKRLGMSRFGRPLRPAGAPLTVLPYPGGRHPRIGFLEGAIDPQRDTKFSVFTPWDTESYVVVDLPEAVWSNLGLTYLAHTHVPTVWTQRQETLPPLEWQVGAEGALSAERVLPNGIRFAAAVRPQPDCVRMQLELTNGTPQPLSDLRVQVCVMLKGARRFEQQTNENKVFENPYVACRSSDGKRWIITAWTRCQRPWANEQCPCLHSDPQFPDCPPGETQKLLGWLSFYEGPDVYAEFQRINATGWRDEVEAPPQP